MDPKAINHCEDKAMISSLSKPKQFSISTAHRCPKFGMGCCLDIGLAELAIRGEASVVCFDCQQGPETR